MRRFAIYFTPDADAPVTRLASSWLGRDAFLDFVVPTAPLNGFSREVWRAATSEPRRYGFHATLKPPFRLAKDSHEEDLRQALRQFAATRSAFIAPPLRLKSLSSFLALTLSAPCGELENLADDCVRGFDKFRALPNEDELARRRRARLTAPQMENLERWGYPYVMDQWRFHMTLTSSLDPEMLLPIQSHLAELFAPHCVEPIPIDALYLFEQPAEQEPFHVLERFPLR